MPYTLYTFNFSPINTLLGRQLHISLSKTKIHREKKLFLVKAVVLNFIAVSMTSHILKFSELGYLYIKKLIPYFLLFNIKNMH